jgi:hypothetical protein
MAEVHEPDTAGGRWALCAGPEVPATTVARNQQTHAGTHAERMSEHMPEHMSEPTHASLCISAWMLHLQAEVHKPAPAGARCALCAGPEAPGCHADQATATPATGMSRQGLGPLMPVSMAQQQQQQQQQQGVCVVWVHRQCALWSPEVYPGRRSMLVSYLA